MLDFTGEETEAQRGKPRAQGTQSVTGGQDLSPAGLTPKLTLFQSVEESSMAGSGLHRGADREAGQDGVLGGKCRSRGCSLHKAMESGRED